MRRIQPSKQWEGTAQPSVEMRVDLISECHRIGQQSEVTRHRRPSGEPIHHVVYTGGVIKRPDQSVTVKRHHEHQPAIQADHCTCQDYERVVVASGKLTVATWIGNGEARLDGLIVICSAIRAHFALP